MKKLGILALMGLLTTASYALAPTIGWVGLGASTGGFANFQGTQVSPLDTGKLTIFGGLGFSVLPPVPLYVGLELNLMIAQVGEDSQTALVYNQLLVATGQGYEFYAWLSEAQFRSWYFDLDLSPRVVATLNLVPGTLSGTAFVGLNFNYLTMSWEYDNPPNPKQEGSETLAGPVVQALAGLRASVLFFYLDYTRYFNIRDDGKVNRNEIAGNRVSLGVHFAF